ncbi:hypothetical protein N9W34_01940 [Rickettsiales bacterium]|nr:hypothetical protein [Rickettsiales bacterium]
MKKFRSSFIFILSVFLIIAYSQTSYAVQISVRSVDSISIDGVGLLSPENGGIEYGAYKNSDHALISSLLSNLYDYPASNAMQKLKIRLLLSKTLPIDGKKGSVSIFISRIKNLARIGDSKSINAMLAIIPIPQQSEEMQEILTAAYFINSQLADACKIAQKYDSNILNFWKLASIICKAQQGKLQEAELEAELFSESGATLPKDFKIMLPNFTFTPKHQALAQISWEKYINDNVLNLPVIKVPFPMPDEDEKSLLKNVEHLAWWNQKEKLSEQDIFNKASSFYILLHSSGYEPAYKQLRMLMIYALDQKLEIPQTLQQILLLDAVISKRQAEAILLILNIAANKYANELDFSLFSNITRSLSVLGLTDEAKLFVQERLDAQKQQEIYSSDN